MFPILIDTTDSEEFVVFPHAAEDDALADIVLKDLQDRYPKAVVKKATVQMERLCFDQGGAIMASWEMAQVGVLHFWPHQIDATLHGINTALEDVRETGGVKFCKLRCNYNIICLYETTLQSIKADILKVLDEYRKAGTDNIDNFHRALDLLKGHPNLKVDQESKATVLN